MNPVTKTATMSEGNVAPLMIVLFFIAVAALIVFLAVIVVRSILRRTGKKPAKQENRSVMEELSESLKQHRIKNEMSPEAVAEALGVSKQTVLKWESGTSVPTSSDLLALSKLYKTTPSKLFSAE